MGTRGFLPSHASDRRADWENLTPAERFVQAMELSRSMTALAASAAGPVRLHPLDARGLLCRLLEYCEFVVAGVFATAAHGYVRATDRLEIVVDESSVISDSLLRVLASDDTSHEPCAGESGRFLSRHGRLDVIQRMPDGSGYDAVASNAVELDVEGLSMVRIIGYQDLVRALALGTPQDREDLARLREARGES